MTTRFGRRMRRGVAGTAVAAVAMAALTGSQAPGATSSASAPDQVTPPPGPPISGGSPYYTKLPPLVKPDKPEVSADLPGTTEGSVFVGGAGIPQSVLAAYRRAGRALDRSHPGCNLPWQLLAAIGQVESGQARRGNVDSAGTTLSPIRGPQLNGDSFARITDTDNGRYDGDTVFDRAVGPMQFIPSTWAAWGADGNGDGQLDPNNVYDAALAAGRYLCAAGRDLSDPGDLDRAILGYNHSQEYLRTVKSWFDYFKNGHRTVPDSPVGATGDDPAPSSSQSADPSPSASPRPSASSSKPAGRPSGSAAQPTPAGKPKPTASASGSIRPVSPSPTPSDSGTGSPSPSPSPSCPSASPSPSPSPSSSGSPSGSPSGSVDPSAQPAASPSESASPSASPSEAGEPDSCGSPSPSPSESPSSQS